jgi:hyperosmotically inducible protein
MIRIALVPLVAFGILAASLPAEAQLGTLLSVPKTLIDRAIEARSTVDIAKDNEIVIKVNAVMAKLGTIKASTEIYEQRLLVTGLFEDANTYNQFKQGVEQVSGIKKLYWHVKLMSDADQKAAHLMDWADVLVMCEKAQARLIGTAGVADVNFRTACDSSGTVYLLGRARSTEEGVKARARVADGNGVKKVVDYVVVRP